MTFAETHKLVNAIASVETWTRSLDRLHKEDVMNFEQITKVEKWLEKSKQEIFDIASK